MLTQYIRIEGNEDSIEWNKKSTANEIARRFGVQAGRFGGIVYNDITNKLYQKHEMQNIVNGAFPGRVPVFIELLVDDKVVGEINAWLITITKE